MWWCCGRKCGQIYPWTYLSWFSDQFFITRVTATPGFKILDGHVHYQSLDKTDNMSECQLNIKETRYSTVIRLRNVHFLKITRSMDWWCLERFLFFVSYHRWYFYSKVYYRDIIQLVSSAQDMTQNNFFDFFYHDIMILMYQLVFTEQYIRCIDVVHITFTVKTTEDVT